ncbi:hypothetical protein H5T57_02210 [Candidatus Bipolaricaulota bacterium]|nr:hypothetical protein [Candidatus Bipolaricaulota bacterium]
MNKQLARADLLKKRILAKESQTKVVHRGPRKLREAAEIPNVSKRTATLEKAFLLKEEPLFIALKARQKRVVGKTGGCRVY